VEAEAHAAEAQVILNDEKRVAGPQTTPEPWEEVRENHPAACVLVEGEQLWKKQTIRHSKDVGEEEELVGQVYLGLADPMIA
jgi:hypothetical protein